MKAKSRSRSASHTKTRGTSKTDSKTHYKSGSRYEKESRKKNHLDPNLSQDHSLGLGQNLDQGLGLVLSPVATDSTNHDNF